MKKYKAFTLIEIMFVVAVIVILMLLVIPEVTSKSKIVKDKGCEALLSVINAQIVLYEIGEGQLPNGIQDLHSKNYITQKQTICPNGKSIGINQGEAYVS
jgi:prepilin-type N-terminal cleavage/methylation domain